MQSVVTRRFWSNPNKTRKAQRETYPREYIDGDFIGVESVPTPPMKTSIENYLNANLKYGVYMLFH